MVDGVEHLVEVSYTIGGVTNTITASQYDYFGEIDNLAPNASSFIGPLAGVYSESVSISWNPARDPNNDNVFYNIYLYDIGTQTDVFTIAEDLEEETTFSFNTTPETDPPGDGVYNIRIEACDNKGLCSSSFFLYDIYDIGEEFVIANHPFTWIGGRDNDWNNQNNWLGNQIPSVDNLAFIPESVTRDLVIGNDVNAKARRLSIAAGRTVTITAGGKLEVTQSLANEAGAANLIVEPDASLIHNTPWPSEGVPATVKHYVKESTGSTWNNKNNPTEWFYISHPVGTQTITTVLTEAGLEPSVMSTLL